MDKKRLTCKVCDFKSDNLVAHINSNHADKAGSQDPLVWYLVEYGLDEADLIHPDADRGEKVAKPKTTKTSGDKVLIASTEIPKGVGGSYVPSITDGYHFGAQADDVAQDINENRRIMLVGHTGCGKTSMIEQIAARIGQGVLRVNMNGQTTIGDFVGFWTAKGGETVWVDGALPKAVKEGLWLIVDEIDFAEPAILAALNAVLEKNGKLTLKEKGHEVLVPHKDFRLFATANTVGCMSGYRSLYQGTNLLNEAFLDRWRCYHIDYLSKTDEAAVLLKAVPKVTPTIADTVVLVGNMVREAFLKEELSCTFSLRRLIDWTELIVRHRNALKAAEASIFSKVSKEDAEVIKKLIEHNMTRSSKS